jgi:hypothetical protein
MMDQARGIVGCSAVGCGDLRHSISDCDRDLLRGFHVRTRFLRCSRCAAFAAAIQSRRRDLQSLDPPLARSDATKLLARVLAESSDGAPDRDSRN